MALREDEIGIDESLLAAIPAAAAPQPPTDEAPSGALQPLSFPTQAFRLDIPDFAAAMGRLYGGFHDRIPSAED